MLLAVLVSNRLYLGMGKHSLLAGRIRELRAARNWTQQDLSRASGLTRSYISRLEMGDIALPASEKLRALASALGTSPDDLLQAAGFLDSPLLSDELPDIKIYLRRKYAIDDPYLLNAVETVVNGLRNSSASLRDSADLESEKQPPVRIADEHQSNAQAY